MEKILLIVLCFQVVSAQFSGSKTTTMKLAQIPAGNYFVSGTQNDTTQANASFNYNMSRIDALWSRQHNGTGWFTSLYGDSTANLNIGLAGLQHNKRVVFRDSTYMYYNLFSEGSALFAGNLTIGGYITTDSIQTAGKLYLSDTLTVNYIQLLNGMSNTNGSISTRGFFSTGFASSDDGYVRFYNGTNSNFALLQASTIASSNKTLELPNENGTLATTTTSDSIQTPTIHAVLFNSEKVASSTLNDTSALFTDWSSTSTTEYPIVRIKYLHKTGITNIVARYYAYIGGGGDNWEAVVTTGSLTSATTSGSNTSYGSMSTTTLTVSGLTANTLYDLQFKIGTNTLGTSHFKELVITAESQ